MLNLPVLLLFFLDRFSSVFLCELNFLPFSTLSIHLWPRSSDFSCDFSSVFAPPRTKFDEGAPTKDGNLRRKGPSPCSALRRRKKLWNFCTHSFQPCGRRHGGLTQNAHSTILSQSCYFYANTEFSQLRRQFSTMVAAELNGTAEILSFDEGRKLRKCAGNGGSDSSVYKLHSDSSA